MSPPSRTHQRTDSRLTRRRRRRTYAVQVDADLTASVDGRLLAAQLAHFAEDADGLVGELLEVGGRDAGGDFCHFRCWCSASLLIGEKWSVGVEGFLVEAIGTYCFLWAQATMGDAKEARKVVRGLGE